MKFSFLTSLGYSSHFVGLSKCRYCRRIFKIIFIKKCVILHILSFTIIMLYATSLMSALFSDFLALVLIFCYFFLSLSVYLTSLVNYLISLYFLWNIRRNGLKNKRDPISYSSDFWTQVKYTHMKMMTAALCLQMYVGNQKNIYYLTHAK